MSGDDTMLRVHSNDLHQHVMEEVGKCFENNSYTDMAIRCKDGEVIHAHRLVLCAVSPFFKWLLENAEYEDCYTIELPETSYDDGLNLVDVIYNGMVEATLEELKSIILLARQLFIAIPVSDELLKSLNLAPAQDKCFFIPPSMVVNMTSPQIRLPTVPLPLPPSLRSINLTQSTQLSAKESGDEAPLPPPLKRIREDLPHLQVSPNRPPMPTMLNRNPNPQKEYLCPFCNSKYNNVGNFKQHMKFHESENAREERSQMMNSLVSTCFRPETNLYTCEICRSTYSHPGNFKQHLGKHERETGAVTVLYQQKFGNLPITSRPMLSPGHKASDNMHLNRALQSSFADRVDNGDATLRQYHCEICSRTFKHPGNYKQHMASHMRTTNSTLGLMSLTKGSLPLSAAPGTAAKTSGLSVQYKCGICDEIFNSDANLQQHKTTFHLSQQSSVVDPLVGKPSNSSELDNKSGNLFHCDSPGCLQSFSRETFLSKHKETCHLGTPSLHATVSLRGPQQQPFQTIYHPCKICGKSFSKLSKLTAHMRIHSSPEEHYRYPCDVCGKKFTRPQHVNRHKMLHSGERPFSCEKCLKTFARDDKLKQHQMRDCDLPLTEHGMGHPMDENFVEDRDGESNDDGFSAVDDEDSSNFGGISEEGDCNELTVKTESIQENFTNE